MKTWYRIRVARSHAEILLYEEIGAWGVTAKQFADDLAARGELRSLAVRINSPGGDVFEALAIYNTLQRQPAKITVFIDGLCASAATIIALAGDETRMVDNGRYMIHEPWTVTMADAAGLQKSADLLEGIAEQLVTLYVRKTGLDPEDIRARMKEETWMTAAEALAAGFIDAIDEPLRIAAKTHDLSRFKHSPRTTPMDKETLPPETDPSPPIEPEPESPPEAPPEPAALDPIAVAHACLQAHEPDLIPVLLAAPVSALTLQTRIAQAGEVRRLCALAHQPEQAGECIAAGLTPDQTKLRLWDALVAADRAIGELDTTPPPTKKPPSDPTLIARSALQYQQAQAAIGFPLSFAEAVAHVSKTGVPV